MDLAAACAAGLASALTSQHVLGKAQAVALYGAAHDGPWTDFVLTLYRRCHTDWQDQIPDAEEEREELRSYCEVLLAFENHFLDQHGCE